MITRNTVLILGAGASIPYGYLSGYEMLVEIIEELYPSENIFKRIKQAYGYSEEDLRQFRESLNEASPRSVDAFLETRKGEVPLTIGKAAIAAHLMSKEDRSFLFQKRPYRWYDLLVNKLREDAKNDEDFIKQNNLSIITFNYDRSLEYFLYNALLKWYNLEEDLPRAVDLFLSIEIVHVYGILGQPDFLSNSGREYKLGPSSSELMQAASELKIVHEDERHPDSPEFERARELITGAKIIGVLGFGWDKVNRERLQLVEILRENQGQNLYGTTHGLTQNQGNELVEAFRPLWDQTSNSVEFQNMKVLELLQTRPVLR